MPVTFAIIVDRKHRKQYDGDNLQSQGYNGELEPHVGGICRHPETNSGYLLHSVTRAYTPVTHSLARSVLQRLCCVKGGKKVVSGFKLMQVSWWPMAGQKTRAWVNTPLWHFVHGDGFPLWTSEGTKQNINVMTLSH